MSGEACGSWRVLGFIEGHEAELRWCNRVDGSCPFPGTPASKDTGEGEPRPCAASGVTYLRVSWAESCIDRAATKFEEWFDGGALPSAQDVQVAIDALRTCGAKAEANSDA